LRKSKYDPALYELYRAWGLSNREIARRLEVDEASVRRGLKSRDDSAALLTDRGRARQRRFRLREYLTRMHTRLKETP
jgi:transposase